MTAPIVTFGKMDFQEFSVFLHKTIEKYSSSETLEDYSFYIPPDSLDQLYDIEKRTSSNSQNQSNKIKMVMGSDRQFTLFQKILSRTGISSLEEETRRTVIGIYDFGNHDFGGMGLPKYFKKVLEGEILGVVLDLAKKNKMYDRNISHFMSEYFKKDQDEKHLFLVLSLGEAMGEKIISRISSKEGSSKVNIRARYGKKLMKKELPKTWKVIDRKEEELASLDFFYTSHLKIKKVQPTIEGFESVSFHSHIAMYPYQMYLDLLSHIKEKCEGTFSQRKVMDEISE